MNSEQEQEFREFVNARSNALLRTAYLLTGDWEHGRDLVQSALASTARRWTRLEERGQAEAYVRRAIYNAQVDRTRLRSWRCEQSMASVPDRSGTESDLADRVAGRQDLLAALTKLPNRQRAVIVLRYFEDRTDAETADLLGVSVGTVRSQRHKALTALRVTVQHPTSPTLEASA